MGKTDGQSDSFVEESYASMAQTGPSQHIPDFAPQRSPLADERNDPRLLPHLNPLANERNDPQVSVIIYTTPSGDIDESGVFAHRLDDPRAYFCSASFPRCRGKAGIADDFSGLGVCVVHACLVFLELGLLMS